MRETRKKEKLEKELKQIQTDRDTRQTEIKALQQYVQKSKEELQRLEPQLKEQKVCGVPAALRVPTKTGTMPWFVVCRHVLYFLWKAANSLHSRCW